MSFQDITIFLKRATGLWYRDYPPLAEMTDGETKARELSEKTDELAKDIRRLDRELRKNGRLRIYHSGHPGD